MTSIFFLGLFLIVLALYLAVEAALICLNWRHVRRHSAQVPAFAASHVDVQTFQRSCEYTFAKSRFALFGLLYSNVFLLLFLLLGGFGAVDDALAAPGWNRYVHGIVYVFFISVLFAAVDLPLSLYGTFVLEERFGFNKTSLRLWAVDLIKGLMVSALILTPLLLALFWCMAHAGGWWWLYTFFLFAAVQLFLVYILPVWILPLFNTFTPLPEGELKQMILDLCARAAYRTAGVFLMDGSKRSTHANAYFTGFGATKRIVLFDTLVEQLKPAETAAVLAHEIGHEKLGHIKKSLLLSLAAACIGLYILDRLMGQAGFYGAFGFSRPSDHAALVVFLFASSPFLYFLSPLSSALSRRFEYQADRAARELAGAPDDLRSGLLTLSQKSLSNLVPHPWYSFFHYSHPTLGERLQALEKP